MQPMLLERPVERPDLPGSAAAHPIPRPAVHFESEVRRCQGQLFRIALSITGSEADAWDAVQEALVRAYTHLHQYRGESAFSTWLIRILYRTCYDELRRRSRRPLLPAAGQDLPEGPPGEDPTMAAAPDPAELAEQSEMQQLVRRTVARLPAPFRAVVTLQLAGLSYLEIGDRLNLPPGTVKSRLHRARLMMRDELAPVSPPRSADVWPVG